MLTRLWLLSGGTDLCQRKYGDIFGIKFLALSSETIFGSRGEKALALGGKLWLHYIWNFYYYIWNFKIFVPTHIFWSSFLLKE